MPINDIQAKALELIQTDPEAFRLLQQQVDRLDPEGKIIPKTALPDILAEKNVERFTKPLQDEVKRLNEKLSEKLQYDENLMQREFMRRNYKMNDAQIDDLAKWMKEDGDGNVYKSYEAAHKYRLSMQQPIIPNGSASPNKVNPMTGRTVRSEPWREDIAKRRREAANPRTQDRLKAREEWGKTLSELRNKGN